MAGAATGLDATNTFLSAMQGLSTTAMQAGQNLMGDAKHVGELQEQVAIKDQMQEQAKQIDAIHANGESEVRQRAQVTQFQQKALIQVASMGGSKEQLAAIQNLVPPIPQTAQEAMIRGQALGDKSMMAAGKNIFDMEQAAKLKQIATEAKYQAMLQLQTVDTQTVKGLIEQGGKSVSALQSTIPAVKAMDTTFQAAYNGLGVSYNPATKQLLNLQTKKSVMVQNPTDIPRLITAWKNPGQTSEGIAGSVNRIGSGLLGRANSTTSQADTYAALMQSRMAIMAKQIGVRVGATQKGLEMETMNVPSTGDAWQRQIEKLVQLHDRSFVEHQENLQIINRVGNAMKSKSRNPSDYMSEVLPNEVPPNQVQTPVGGVLKTTGPGSIPGVNFNPRGK